MAENIIAAVEAARAQPHPFVFVPRDASAELREALAELATELGREVLVTGAHSPIAEMAKAAEDDDRPTISRQNKRAFIASLKDIALGRVRVV